MWSPEWPTSSTTSVTPDAASVSSCQSTNGRPSTGTIALGSCVPVSSREPEAEAAGEHGHGVHHSATMTVAPR